MIMIMNIATLHSSMSTDYIPGICLVLLTIVLRDFYYFLLHLKISRDKEACPGLAASKRQR